MGIVQTIDAVKDLTVFTVSGSVTYTEQLEALRGFYGGRPTRNILWDFRALEGDRVSPADLKKLLEFVKTQKDRRGRGRTALVAESRADFGLARLCEEYAGVEEIPWPIRAFRSMEEAMDWIAGG